MSVFVAGGRRVVGTTRCARAAIRALAHGAPGVYNIAEPGGSARVDKGLAQLGRDPGFRLAP